VDVIKTIMVVDDETSVLEQVRSFLDYDEFEIITVNNSRQALDQMDKEKKFDLILIDTPMPASQKTAFFSLKPDSKMKNEQNNNFLQKPFTKEQLVNFVKEKI